MTQLMKKAEAAQRLNISIRQLELFVSAGRIRVHRFGAHCVRIDASEIERFANTALVS